VEWWTRYRAASITALVIASLIVAHQVWYWMIERVEVPAGSFLVVIKLWGKDLEDGQIIAPDSSFKGVQRRTLAEGRHFLNPLWYRYEVHKVLVVPEGKAAVLTRKTGKEISEERKRQGDYLARGKFKLNEDEADDEEPERGILPGLLLPKTYRINPYEYEYELVNAIVIGPSQVGVRTLKFGKDPKGLGLKGTAYTVPEGFRGVQVKAVTQGVHYINPYLESITIVDVRSHPVEFKDISFPSRDGFTIQPKVLVAYKVVPEMAAELFVLLCDEGLLPQEDGTPEKQQKNPILSKVVLPLIRGYVRIEGSKYDARDYVSQQGADAVNPREKMQEELMKKVAPVCKKVGVVIESITLAEFESNEDLRKLSEQIAEREQTRVARERNKKLVEKYRTDQEKKAKELLAQQEKRTVDANAKLKVEKTKAKQAMEVEEAKLKTELQTAQATLEAAQSQAQATLTRGKAAADVILADNAAEVAGLKTGIEGFPSPQAYAQYHVLTRLSPALSEIFASDSSEFAKLFSGYMSLPRSGSVLAPPRAGDATSQK
jgi:regulator of protease activity HflC (stomatin/prohibitin superfamily)